MRRPLRIGIDFDNTIVTYDDGVSRRRAGTRLDRCGLRRLEAGGPRCHPAAARRRICLAAPAGHVYGKGIAGARCSTASSDFLRRCRDRRVPRCSSSATRPNSAITIPTRVNLREAALDWMTRTRLLPRQTATASPRQRVLRSHARREARAHRATLSLHAFHRRPRGGVQRSRVSRPTSAHPVLRRWTARHAALPYPVCPTWRASRNACSMDTPEHGAPMAQDVAGALLGAPVDGAAGVRRRPQQPHLPRRCRRAPLRAQAISVAAGRSARPAWRPRSARCGSWSGGGIDTVPRVIARRPRRTASPC